MPTYVKPKNVSYTDMAIYIDKHIYSGNYDANLVYEYIYLIIYVLACKAKYFTKYEDYDDFALYMSSRVYMRLIDKRQFEDIPGEKKLDKIKSSLNFIKNLLYPIKLDFKKENIFDSVVKDEILENNIYRLRISTYCMGNTQYSELKRKADAYDQIMKIKDGWNIQ